MRLFCPPLLDFQAVHSELYQSKQLDVQVLRSDQVHPTVSGNKWFKLKYSILEAQQQGITKIISFGGTYSNHIHALAYAGKELGIETIGYIRGEWSEDNLTLADAQRWGMQLCSVSRQRYREKHTQEFSEYLRQEHGDALIIPEGGTNQWALKGVAELMQQLELQNLSLKGCEEGVPRYLIAACGTGGTLAGLIAAASQDWKILGIPVLKGAAFLKDDINGWLGSGSQSAGCEWELDLQGHYGGYGKVKADHLQEMFAIEQAHNVLLDPVYTAKMWRRFNELVAQDFFPLGSAITLLHSGGLQGRRGFGLEADAEGI